MKILITGASGFLGRHLIKRLKTEVHEIVGLSSRDCDLRKQTELEKILGNQKFDQIFHLAVVSKGGDYCSKHLGEQWMANQRIDTNVLCWWKEFNPSAKMIAIGSSCAYDPDLPLTEENYLRGKPTDNFFAYGNSKRMLYVGLSSLSKEFGLEYMLFVPSVLYGRDYHTDGRPLHFIYDLTRKIMRGKFRKDDVILWGDGEQQRELVHVEDFINIMLNINARYKNEIVNIGYGKGTSIKEFARIICDIIGFDFSKIIFDTTKPSGAKSKYLDIKKMKLMCPAYQMKDYSEGIRELVGWMMENKELFLES